MKAEVFSSDVILLQLFMMAAITLASIFCRVLDGHASISCIWQALMIYPKLIPTRPNLLWISDIVPCTQRREVHICKTFKASKVLNIRPNDSSFSPTDSIIAESRIDLWNIVEAFCREFST